jgi:hypothetical protein
MKNMAKEYQVLYDEYKKLHTQHYELQHKYALNAVHLIKRNDQH